MSDDRPSPEEITADSPLTLPGFFDALAEGTLYAGVCECGQVLLPPRPACYACGSRRVSVEEQRREGEIISHTEVRAPPPVFESEAPYTVAIVELASGGRLTGRVDADHDDVEIGAPVELTVREPSGGVADAALSYEQDWPVHVFEPR
jgi:uncharacterized OB-fold protein